MKKTVIVFIILAVIAVIAVPRIIEYRDNSQTEETVRPLTVEGTAAKRMDLEVFTNVIGNSEASASVPVMVSVPAKVIEIMAATGDHVEKDDVLFVLDGKDVEKQVTQSELAVDQAQAGVQQALAGIRNARQGINNAALSYDMAVSNYNINLANYEYAVSNLASFKVLYDEGIVSKSEYDQVALQASPETKILLDKQLEQASSAKTQAEVGLDQAQAAYNQAQAGLEQAKQGLDTASETLADLAVKAPAAGYVTALNVEKDVYAPNTQASAMIEDVDSIKVTVSLTGELIGKVSKGDKVAVHFTNLDSEYTGTVDAVAMTADDRTLLYPVEILVENKSHDIKPGMFVTVDILSASSAGVLAVPNDAVLTRNGQDAVYVQTGDSSVERRVVETGLDSGSYIEIRSGLEEGDVVIVKGVGLISEESTLNIVRGDE